MARVARAATGGPSLSAPYVDAPDDENPVSVGITASDTVAVRLTPPSADEPVTATVVSGTAQVDVGATAQEATGQKCTVSPDGLLYLHGKTAGGCRIELSQKGGLVGTVEPRVYDRLELKVRLWMFATSADGTGADRPLTIYDEEVDTARLMADVAAYWRPAGIDVTCADVRNGRLRIDPADPIREATHAALQADGALRAALGGAKADEVVNVVLVPVYDRLGFTVSAWGRDDYDQAEPVSKDLSGFAGPVVIVAVRGSIEYKDMTWASRSTDVAVFGGKPDGAADADSTNFHYLSLGSDVAHELGHMLGLAHSPQTSPGGKAAPYQFTALMYSNIVQDGSKWQQPGWPETQRGAMSETRDATTKLAAAVVSGQTAQTLRLDAVERRMEPGTMLVLVDGRRCQSVVTAAEIPAGELPSDRAVVPFTATSDFPVGARVLKQAVGFKLLKGGLIPARSADQARQHITNKRAFGH